MSSYDLTWVIAGTLGGLCILLIVCLVVFVFLLARVTDAIEKLSERGV